jgi:diguanylate cyclase (GGDEF)-like protein
MFSRLFPRPDSRAPQVLLASSAEGHLIHETMLRASVKLLGNPEPAAAVEHMLESLLDATPHMPLAWAWLGAAAIDQIEPSIVVGGARVALQSLSIERHELSQGNPRVLEISALSRYPLWRELAQRFDIKSALLVPIRSSDDDRGMLCLYSTRSGFFSGADSVQFEALGRWCYDVVTYQRRPHPLAVEVERDQVTGLLSRRHARRVLEDAWRQGSAWTDHNNRGVLLLIDVDGLKKINDICGNRVGNMALQHLARCIESILRRSDVIARWGDDEILAWLPAESANTAGATAERVRGKVETDPPDALIGQAVDLRVSIGATAVPLGDSLVDALDRLDQALAHAKRSGGNCVYVARTAL